MALIIVGILFLIVCLVVFYLAFKEDVKLNEELDNLKDQQASVSKVGATLNVGQMPRDHELIRVKEELERVKVGVSDKSRENALAMELIARLKAQLEQASGKVADAAVKDQEILMLKSELEYAVRLGSDAEKLKEALNAATAEIQENKNKVVSLNAELEKMAAEGQRSLVELKMLQETLADQKNDLSAKDQEIQTLKADGSKDELPRLNAEIGAAQERLRAQQSALAQKDQEIKVSKAELESVKVQLEDAAQSSKDELQRLNAEVKAAQERLHAQVSGLAVKDQEIKMLKAALENAQLRLENVEGIAKGQIESLSAEVKSLKGRLEKFSGKTWDAQGEGESPR